jgi:hypothetical protein
VPNTAGRVLLDLSATELWGLSPAGQMVPHSMVQVIADYSTTEPGALSMRKGELATLVELTEQGWCVVKIAAGARGYFPLSYLQPAPPAAVRAPSAAPVTAPAPAPAAPAPGAKPLVAAAPQYRSDGGWESFSRCSSTRSREIAPPAPGPQLLRCQYLYLFTSKASK